MVRASTTGAGSRQFSRAGEMIMGRYKVNEARDLLGAGAASKTYRARDTRTNKDVALKTFAKDSDLDEETQLEMFRSEIEAFRKLFGQGNQAREITDPDFLPQTGGQEARAEFQDLVAELQQPACFVKVLDFSKDAEGNPGRNVGDGQHYTIMELAKHSLLDWIVGRADKHEGLSTDELREVLFALVEVTACLHERNLVHADLKPENVMWFPQQDGGRWKLIDFAGAHPVGPLEETEISYTLLYCPPEVAKFFSIPVSQRTWTLQVARTMDVWSIGILGVELLFLENPLDAKLLEMDTEPFMRWLGAGGLPPSDPWPDLVPEALKEIEPPLFDLLHRMLAVDPSQRLSIGEVFMHEFFKSCRENLAEQISERKRKAAVRSGAGPGGEGEEPLLSPSSPTDLEELTPEASVERKASKSKSDPKAVVCRRASLLGLLEDAGVVDPDLATKRHSLMEGVQLEGRMMQKAQSVGVGMNRRASLKAQVTWGGGPSASGQPIHSPRDAVTKSKSDPFGGKERKAGKGLGGALNSVMKIGSGKRSSQICTLQ